MAANEVVIKNRGISVTSQSGKNSEDAKKVIFSKFDGNLFTSVDSSLHVIVPETEETEEKEFKRKEGGWGWAVAFGSFLMFASYTSFLRIYPILYEEIRERFQSSAQSTAWLSATHNLIRFSLGIIVAGLLKMISARKLTIIGTFIYSTGIIVTAFASCLKVVFFGFSILGAVGAALFQISSLVTVSEYFDKQKGKAMAITFCGPPVGGILGSLVIAKLFDRYSFSGTLLILAGISLNVCISGMLFRPKEPLDKGDKETPMEKKSLFHSFKDIVKSSSVDISLFKDVQFTLFLVFLFLVEIIMSGTNLFSYGLAKELNIERSTMANLILITCPPDVITRLVVGFIMDRKSIRRYRTLLYVSFVGCSGILLTFMGYSTSRIYFFSIFIARSLVNSMIYSQMVTVTTDKVDRTKVKDAIGIYRFTNSFPLLIGPTVGGKIRDITGTYRYNFIIGGYLLVSYAAIYAIINITSLILNKKGRKEKETEVVMDVKV
ncbi:DgyrCDS6721 [Dimorphilus gyrociliatus]|uniref:DgyrCDS6721 n=1 Tax=Dimorphilus gyrociliatus TaxID=2664684 RepID=A0A7I8VP02_9ANNE|nr:DgyrCDS6721 [Dimorphilus gyrociliatus]